MRRHIEWVRIELRDELLEIPWTARCELVDRLRALGPEGERVVERFVAVGVSRPVVFDRADEPVLLAVVETWVNDAAGWESTPEGVPALIEALGRNGSTA